MHNPVAQYLRERLPQRPGFTVNPVQIDYAEAICAGLARPGQFHFNEASTGIGKSLAYLLCLADWVARGRQHGRRAVISTHSRSLQRQLLAESNQAIIADYLAWQGLPALTMGLRMGRQNYVRRPASRIAWAPRISKRWPSTSGEPTPSESWRSGPWRRRAVCWT